MLEEESRGGKDIYMCKVNPRVDFVFKKLFATEENKDLLIDFINVFVSEEDKVTDVIIKNPYNEKDFEKDKLSIMDIKAQDVKGTWFNIEMQVMDQDYYSQRALYYWSRLYVSQLTQGVNYDSLQKTISINILNFNCLGESDYHNIYKLLNTKSGQELIRHIEIHFVELEKYDEKISNLMDRWVNFLKKAGEYTKTDMPDELKEIDTIKKAMDALENMSMSPSERERFEARLKWIRDEKAAIDSAEKRGKRAGIKEGELKKAIEIARNILDIADDETIAKKTGLSIDEVKLLREDEKIYFENPRNSE